MNSPLTWLSSDIVGFPVGAANAYLWRHGSTATLIDTGQAGSDPDILDVLSRLGLDRRDLVRIVLTHWHDDHIGAAAALAARTGARVCAGRDDAPVVRGDRAGAPAHLTNAERPLIGGLTAGVPPAPSCRVDRELDDGDTLDAPGHGAAVVLAVPGHTPGSIAVHLPRQRVVLTGDVAVHFDRRVTLGPFNTDREQARRSLRRLARLDVESAGVGHGAPVTRDAAAVLAGATDPLA